MGAAVGVSAAAGQQVPAPGEAGKRPPAAGRAGSPEALVARAASSPRAPCPERPRRGRVPRQWGLVMERYPPVLAALLSVPRRLHPKLARGRRAPAGQTSSPTPRPGRPGTRTPRARRRRGDPETFLSLVSRKGGTGRDRVTGWSCLRESSGGRGAPSSCGDRPPSWNPSCSRGRAGSGTECAQPLTAGVGSLARSVT